MTLPYHGIKRLAGDETTPIVKGNRSRILFCDSKGECLETLSPQGVRAFGQEPCAQAPATIPGANTNLCDMPDLFSYPGAKQQGGQAFSIAIRKDSRTCGVE